jgi:hypothetical protein
LPNNRLRPAKLHPLRLRAAPPTSITKSKLPNFRCKYETIHDLGGCPIIGRLDFQRTLGARRPRRRRIWWRWRCPHGRRWRRKNGRWRWCPLWGRRRTIRRRRKPAEFQRRRKPLRPHSQHVAPGKPSANEHSQRRPRIHRPIAHAQCSTGRWGRRSSQHKLRRHQSPWRRHHATRQYRRRRQSRRAARRRGGDVSSRWAAHDARFR